MITMSEFDAAITDHMAHGAMAGGDPLVDSLYSALEAPAREGAAPPVDYAAGLAETRSDPALAWVWPIGVLLAIIASVFYPWGLAA